MLKKITHKYKQGGFDRIELITGILFLFALIPTLRNITEENDINIFFLAAQSLARGENMYTGPHLYGMWYYYSPLFAAAIVPFTFLPMQVVKLVWLFFSLWMIYRIYIILKKQLNIPKNAPGSAWVICIAIAGLYPVYMNLLYGQMTILIVWTCLEAAVLVSRQKLPKAALLMGIGINIKLLPAFFFYYYLLKKNIRYIIYLGLAVLLFIGLPYLFIPPALHTQLIASWLQLINPLNPEHVTTVGEGGFIDFASIVTKYCTIHEVKTEASLNFVNLSHNQVLGIQTAYRMIILLLTAFFVMKISPKTQNKRLSQLQEVSLFLLCIISAFPHQRDYSVFMALPAVALLAYHYFIAGFKPPLWLLACGVVLVIVMGFGLFPRFLGKYLAFYIYEKRLPGMAAILFIPYFIYWLVRYNKNLLQKEVQQDHFVS